jgi:hypothetical protein
MTSAVFYTSVFIRKVFWFSVFFLYFTFFGSLIFNAILGI